VRNVSLASTAARVCSDAVYSQLVVVNWRVKNRLHMYDEAEYRVLHRFIRAGDLVVDIGTNMGQYASRMAEIVGPYGKVISFEAVPLTYQLARRILRRFRNVELHNLALSGAPGRVRMGLFVDAQGKVRTGLSSVIETAVLSNPSSFIEVSASPLDTEVKGRDRTISLIKCDVEGHEMEVLQGAIQVLTEDRPLVLCETNASSLDRMQHFLRPLEYQVLQLGRDRLEAVHATPGVNYFLVPLERSIRLIDD
jgi:FkbM family methyltransferase